MLLDVVCLDFEDESGCIKVCIDREVIEAMPEEEADKIEAGTKMKLTGILKKRGDYALLVTEPSSVEIQGE